MSKISNFQNCWKTDFVMKFKIPCCTENFSISYVALELRFSFPSHLTATIPTKDILKFKQQRLVHIPFDFVIKQMNGWFKAEDDL